MHTHVQAVEPRKCQNGTRNIACIDVLTELDKDVFRFVQGDLFEVGSDKDFDRSLVPVIRNRLRLVVRLQSHLHRRELI